jgi:hypothetical protein
MCLHTPQYWGAHLELIPPAVDTFFFCNETCSQILACANNTNVPACDEALGHAWLAEALYVCSILVDGEVQNCSLPMPAICAEAFLWGLGNMSDNATCGTQCDVNRAANTVILQQCVTGYYADQGGSLPCNVSTSSRRRSLRRGLQLGDNYRVGCTVFADAMALLPSTRASDVLCTGQSYASALVDAWRDVSRVVAQSELNARRCPYGQLPPLLCSDRLEALKRALCDSSANVTLEALGRAAAELAECNMGDFWNRGGACVAGDWACVARQAELSPVYTSPVETLPVLTRRKHHVAAAVPTVAVVVAAAAVGSGAMICGMLLVLMLGVAVIGAWVGVRARREMEREVDVGALLRDENFPECGS